MSKVLTCEKLTKVYGKEKTALDGIDLELDFAASLEARVALLKGLETSIFPKILEQMEVTLGAETLITELHQRGYKVGLVSGGFHEVIAPSRGL